MGPLPGSLAGPRRAHFLRGGAPRPALGRLGRARGRRWLAASAARFTAPRSPRPRRFPGPWTDFSRRALSSRPLRGGRGGTGPPSLPARLPTGADCPQCASTASRRQGGDRPTFNRRRQGSAAMSVAHPTRLETRTKESNARASQRVRQKPRGAMKVRAGARRLRWDPGPAGPGRTTGPSRPQRRGGGA